MRKMALLMAAISLLLAPAAVARVRTGTLAGTVIGTNGKPAVNVAVTAENSDGSTPLGTRTNSQGRFFFPYLRVGLYDVRASRRGTASDWRHNVLVHWGRQTEVTLHLRHIKKRAKIPASIKRN